MTNFINGFLSNQDVDHAEDVCSDDDGRNGHVREQKDDVVEDQIVDDGSSI